MRRIWRDLHLSFRVQYLLIVLLAVSLPVLAANYFVIKQAEEALLEEKQVKLFGLTKQLDLLLTNDFEHLLTPTEQALSKEEQILAINSHLAPLTDRIASSYPGVGIGYYSKELDAVVAYAPSEEFRQNVGKPIAANHPGRVALQTGVDTLHIGQQMRGDIMNAMHVLKRNGQVIGYTWANELTTDVTTQMMRLERNIYAILVVGLVLAIVASYGLFSHVASFIDRLSNEIEQVGKDLGYRLSIPVGVLGRIPQAINEMVNQLVENKSRKEHIIASVQDGIVSLDVHGRIIEWNQRMEQIAGISAEEAVGQSYAEIYPQDPAFPSLLLQTLATGIEQHAIDAYFLRRDGKKVPVNSSTSLLKNGDKVIGAIIVIRDLTEKRQAEEQIRRADRLRAVGELAAGMAHEIRNPLTSIKAFAQILEDGFSEQDASRRTYTNIIVSEVARLNRIVERLLLFAKPSPFQSVYVNFEDIIRETLPLVEMEIRRKQLELTFDIEETKPAILLVDPELIKQVALNLLLNAIHAAPEGGEIRMLMKSDSREVRFYLYNSGDPIPEEHKEDIFNPFFSTKEKGTGLGLSVSQSIIRLYNGSLTVANQPNGVTFCVAIPCSEKEEEL